MNFSFFWLKLAGEGGRAVVPAVPRWTEAEVTRLLALIDGGLALSAAALVLGRSSNGCWKVWRKHRGSGPIHACTGCGRECKPRKGSPPLQAGDPVLCHHCRVERERAGKPLRRHRGYKGVALASEERIVQLQKMVEAREPLFPGKRREERS